MWTPENRKLYDRSDLRYPSDVTDEEWELIKPQIAPAKHGGRKREVDEREIMNAIMYVLSTGCQWRALPKDFPPRSTVWHYLDLMRPAVPEYCRATPTEDVPFFTKPVSSTIKTPSASPSVSMA